LRPIIGNITVVPHVIIGVRSIVAVGTMIDGESGHFRQFIACCVEREELLSVIFLAEEVRGLVKQKRGCTSVTPTL